MKRKVIDYAAIRTHDIRSLNEEVEMHIRNGFQPRGSCKHAISPGGNSSFLQTMVKYEEEK